MAVGVPVDLSEFDVPGRGRGVLDVFRRSYLLRLLVRKGTATRYRNSVLGWVWSYVKPAAQFVIYYFVMGVVLQQHRGMENFPIYLFSGIVLVNLFNEAFGNATTAITDNRALVKKIYLPRELFPIASIIGAFVHFLPQLAILIVVCLFLGWVPTFAGIGGVLFAMFIAMFFALGLGLIFGALNARFRDAQNFVDLIKMFSVWTSPVLYSLPLIETALKDHPRIYDIYTCNPLTVAVQLMHYGFWGQTRAVVEKGGPSAESFVDGFGVTAAIAVAICLVLVIVGQLVFRHFERTFAQDL